MKLWLRINGLEFSSWVVVWKELCKAFRQEGIEVLSHFLKPPDDIENWVEMWWCDPQFWDWSKLPVKLKVGIALSEHRSILQNGRENVIKNINECDILFCPAYSAMQAFKEAPIETPMYLMPFGVNENEFNFYDRNFNENPFKFLHIGVAQFRKGSWLVTDAWLKAFKKDEPVLLTIATPGRITPMYTQLFQTYKEHPQMQFISLLAKSPVSYYQQHHVLLSPHLSEGFGLCIPEAMATGMPALVSRCSAPREYFDKKYGWWIEMSELYAPVSQCLSNTAGLWRLPNVNDLAAKMRYVYEHRDECKPKGIAASEYVKNNMTWRHGVRMAIPVIERVINEKNISTYASV